MSALSFFAELEAKKAETLPAFGGLNLLHIKRQVAVLLGLIGRSGIFDQYTRHDISHIDEMLRSLEWLIPDSTKKLMSVADWLIAVLSIYFHDLAMLVTPGEYAARNCSDYLRYRDEVLFAGPDGADYRVKVLSLGPDEAERFFYQEFVRHKHPERIRAWIMGQAKEHLGVANEAIAEVSNLLEPLGPQFRRDLGLVCESHHLNDLSDLKKYKPSQPYGNSDAETANLQYAAVLLRTADLLHVTSDRTPSIEFRLINPTDPISQQEWAKQMAVKRVRPKLGLNEDGIPDEKATKDTIEVHAYFMKEDGFFGLTSYLSYTAEQLKRNHEWIGTTAKLNLALHEFPWRKIDDSSIETQGFIRDTFEFTLDQARILDLLTGHTLYNDTSVVLRELVQNAIDAVRLQHYPNPAKDTGKVSISWDTQHRILSVTDNGTGMTQKIITNYLLKVGTSRYQNPEFRKEYPQFASISRFGIGVLSTFMIADSVEIVTCHPDDEQARQLTLRSVHGKYLIRLLDKTESAVRPLFPHGTSFKLSVRPSAEMPDVENAASRWIVVPDCEVTVTVNNGTPKPLGFDSPAQALVNLLHAQAIPASVAEESNTHPLGEERKELRVIIRESDGVTLAYAVEWQEYFREWQFVPGQRLRDSGTKSILLGTCIEGVRVEFDSPGFEGFPVLAIANVRGLNAPKTNVARSGIEATPERDAMLRKVYQMYVDHVDREIEELHKNRSFSLTWATGEARFLLSPLVEETRVEGKRPISKALLEETLGSLSGLLVEDANHRSTISAKALSQKTEFWTIECGLFQSAEPLIREAASPASLAQVVRALNVSDFDFPSGLVLCGVTHDDPLGDLAFRAREIDKIIIHTEQRRVDLRWVEKQTSPRWISLTAVAQEILGFIAERGSYRDLFQSGSAYGPSAGLDIASHSIEIDGKANDIGIRVFKRLYLFPETKVANFLKPYYQRAAAEVSGKNTLAAVFVSMFVQRCIRLRHVLDPQDVARKLTVLFEEYYSHAMPLITEILDEGQLFALAEGERWTVFDPSVWRR